MIDKGRRMKLLSVIVPVYNVQKYINRCVDSILAQTFTDFELILVDDGSPDKCGQICDEYAEKDDRVCVIHKENGGLSDARNTGIDWAFENSDSKWITFVDSDDWIHPKYLEALFDAVKKFDVSISMCRFTETDKLVEIEEINMPKLVKPEIGYFLNGKITAHAWGKLYKKSLFQNIRYPIGRLYEDMYITHKLLFLQRNIAVIESGLYFYYFNSESIVRGRWNSKQLDQIEAYEEELLPYFKGKPKNYTVVKAQYIKVLMDQYAWARNDSYQVQAKRLKRKCIKALIRYNGLVIFPIKQNSWRYERTFPIFMKYYWIVKSRIKNRRPDGKN